MDRSRFSGIFSARDWGVSLIGLGGIGAITAVTLAKMGFDPICAWDADEVSDENTGTQLYGPVDVGETKVNATYDLLQRLSPDTDFGGYFERATGDTIWDRLAAPIVISAVDSIDARKGIWAAICGEPWLWYLDARMAAEELVLHVVNGGDRGWYDALLAGQDENGVPNLACTSKATFHTGIGAASWIGAVCRNIVTGRTLPKIVSVSFKDFGMVAV